MYFLGQKAKHLRSIVDDKDERLHVYCTWYKSLSRTLDRAIVSFVKILLAFQMQYNISSKQWHFMPLHKGPLLVWHTEHFRDSERMSYKQSVIFIPNLAYVAHFSQNHPIFLYISTKISLKKVISTEVSGIRLLHNIFMYHIL